MADRQSDARSVDDVIVSPAASGTPPDSSVSSTDAFLALTESLAQDPSRAVQCLVETAMRLTDADSAGVSVQDAESGEPVFRWIATSGEFARYRNGTMPRHFSPCGTVLERGQTLVMRDPARYYPYIDKLHAPVHSALLAPFSRAGQLVGTVWAISHTADKAFTDRDVAGVQELTTFATAILDAIERNA
jgi:GAF domain-containing protein